MAISVVRTICVLYLVAVIAADAAGARPAGILRVNQEPQPARPAPPAGAAAEAAAWAARHAVPLTTLEPGRGFGDLQFFKKIIGGSRIVAFGEGMHGSFEFLTLRNRLFEFLVVEMGFTAIAMETGFTEAVAADDYVLGKADLSREVIRSGFSWSNMATTSNRQLLEWTREYNARPSTTRPVHVYGFDPAGARLGKFPHAKMAADAALDYAASVEPEPARELRARLTPLLPKFSTDDYASLSPEERSALALGLQDLVVLFERRHPEWVAASSALAYFRAHRNAVIARHLEANFRVGGGKAVQAQRGAIQIDNLRAIIEREGPQGRVLVFAHNTHVKKAPAEAGRTSLGRRLAALFGEQLAVIGSTYHEGAVGYVGGEVTAMPAETGTLNAVLAGAVDRPVFALDLRTLPATGALAEWLATGSALRHGFFEGDPSKSFDALVFIRTIGPLRPIP